MASTPAFDVITMLRGSSNFRSDQVLRMASYGTEAGSSVSLLASTKMAAALALEKKDRMFMGFYVRITFNGDQNSPITGLQFIGRSAIGAFNFTTRIDAAARSVSTVDAVILCHGIKNGSPVFSPMLVGIHDKSQQALFDQLKPGGTPAAFPTSTLACSFYDLEVIVSSHVNKTVEISLLNYDSPESINALCALLV
jgi:hypothetical protein